MASDLIINFGNILETPTIFPDERGQVQVTITNQGDQAVTQPFNLSLYASTNPNLDSLNQLEQGTLQVLRGKDELLGTLTTDDDFNPGQSRTFTLDFASQEFRTASVVSPGAYFLIAEVDSGNTIPEGNEGNNIAEGENSQFISTDGTDVVLDWNSTLLNAIQAVATRPITSPPFAARNAAIVHRAIYEALSEASGTAGASREAAVVGAAHQALSRLYGTLGVENPTQGRIDAQAAFDAQRNRSREEIQDSATAENAGFDIGVRIANRIVDERRNDGSAGADDVPYLEGDEPGEWRPTFTRGETAPSFGEALLPGWGEVTPFDASSVEDLLDVLPNRVLDDVFVNRVVTDGPPELGTIQYGLSVNAVKFLGDIDRYRDPNINLTENQAEIAYFWSYDRPDTFGPPGQWQEIAQEIALQQNNTLEENATLFAQLTTAMANAGIVAWDLKYGLGGDDSLGFNQWRPITAIREAPGRINDPTWEPLLDTPPFPDYVSGHAAFGGAAGRVLRRFYNTNNISFDIPSQDLPGEFRQYDSFSEAVRENALSRIYGGIHIGEASLDGVLAGIIVGEAAANFASDNFSTIA